jgi:hypothetical protein
MNYSGQATKAKRHSWIKRGIAIVAVLNLLLVLFDLTYLNMRSLYFETVPSLVQIYDSVKGIHPHPETQRYLAKVAALEVQLAQSEVLEVEAALTELRSYSDRLIQDHPFPDNGTLATIQQNLQSRTAAETSFVAFDRFWSQDYLAENDWQAELAFWNQQIQPLMAANYYRQVNRFGQSIDYFWLIDLPFVLVFAIDIAIRDRAIRRDLELSRLESLLRRWYDLFLLLPLARWLRILPVTLRLQQVGLINSGLLEAEVRRDFTIGFAKEITQVVGTQAIDQMQKAIRCGDVMRWLLYPETRRTYVQVNDCNELEVIIARLADITVYQVLPQIQPELDQFISHSLHHIVEEFPGYRQLQIVPGMSRLPKRTTERLTKNFSQNAYQSLVKIWSDPEISEIKNQLIKSFRASLTVELQKKHNTKEFEDLLIDMLEEIKINYIKGVTDAEIDQILDEVKQLDRNA